jgi:hypothetical protein
VHASAFVSLPDHKSTRSLCCMRSGQIGWTNLIYLECLQDWRAQELWVRSTRTSQASRR